MSDLPLIFRLMPAFYRDADGGAALLALSKVLDDARASVRADIEALHRDWFAETCDSRLLPRIGELVGLLPFEREAHAPRAMVADAIAFRQRKGSVAAIERRLAALVGWPVRLSRGHGPGAIRVEVWLDEALTFARATPRPAREEECPAREEDCPAREEDRRAGDRLAGCYHLDALGRDVQLVNPPRPCPGLDAPFVESLDAPVPLTRESPPEALARAIAITLGDGPLPPEAVAVGDLGEWQPGPAADPIGVRAIVDPELGRLMLLDVPAPASVAVDYARGAPARIGGGPYERESPPMPKDAWLAYVHGRALPRAAQIKGQPPAFATVRDALAAFDAVPGPGVIRILDSGIYDVADIAIGALPDACPPDPAAPRRLVIEALSGEAPCLVGALALRGRDPGLHVTFAGLWLDGTLTLAGPVTLELEHCTLYPSAAWRERSWEAPAIVAEEGAEPLRLTLRHCLSGPLHVPREAELAVADSVVDGGRDGHAVAGRARGRVERTTFVGAVALWRVKAVDTIFAGRLDVADRLWGELRTSHVRADAHGPRRTECVVTLAALAWESLAPGTAGYARLAVEVEERLRVGGSAGGEMGAHHGRGFARRMALLREGAESYLPPGMAVCVLTRAS